MNLILWRHAEAEDGVPGRIPDAARALTLHGHKQAKKMAKWLNERLPEDCLILVSPAVRTQQTAAELGRPFTTTVEVSTSANAEDVLAAVKWEPDSGQSVLVVGHQPTLGQLGSILLAGQAGDLSLKKGALLWIKGHTDGNVLKAALSPGLV